MEGRIILSMCLVFIRHASVMWNDVLQIFCLDRVTHLESTVERVEIFWIRSTHEIKITKDVSTFERLAKLSLLCNILSKYCST